MKQAAVESALAPFSADLSQLVRDGFADYSREYSQVSHKHHARTRASIIHDHVFENAKARLLQNKQFQQVPTRIRNLLDFKGLFILQFKKLNRALHTSNLPTQLALDLSCQRQVTFAGIPPTLPRLAIGYVPNATWTDIDGIYLTYAVGKKLVWYIDLTGQSGGQLAFPAPAPHDTPAQPAKRVIRAKIKRRRPDDESAASV